MVSNLYAETELRLIDDTDVFGPTGAEKHSNSCEDLQCDFRAIVKGKDHFGSKELVSTSIISVFMQS